MAAKNRVNTQMSARISDLNDGIDQTLNWFDGKMPELSGIARQFITHCDREIHDAYMNVKAKTAVLLLLKESDAEKAITRIAERIKINGHNAQKLLLDTINNGPEGLLEDEAFFEARGLVRGTSRYNLMPPALQDVPDLTELKNNIPSEYQPIFKAAIDCAYSSQTSFGTRVSPSVFPYILAQLQPDEQDKDRFFERLAKQASNPPHHKGIERSTVAIQILADALDIDLTPLSLKGDLKNIKPKNRGQDAPEESEANVEKALSLSQELNCLVLRGAISTTECKAYLWLSEKEKAGVKPPMIALQSMLLTKGAQVSFTAAAEFKGRVDNELTQLRTEVQQNNVRFALR